MFKNEKVVQKLQKLECQPAYAPTNTFKNLSPVELATAKIQIEKLGMALSSTQVLQ